MFEHRSGPSEGHDCEIEGPEWGKLSFSRRELIYGAGGLVALGLASFNRPSTRPAAVRPPPPRWALKGAWGHGVAARRSRLFSRLFRRCL